MNKIKAIFTANSTKVTTEALWQYDYGQILEIKGFDLPSSYEVHFTNDPNGTATTTLGDENGVAIPDVYLRNGNVTAYLYLHTGESDGETVYQIDIPVRKRAGISNQPPTPVQQDVITQTIAALNSAVESVPTAIDEALAEAKASGEFDGKDGADGKDGVDGHSPVVTANKSGKVTTISVDGTAIATVNDGEDGQSGQPGQDGKDGIGLPSGGTTGQVLAKKSGTDYDTEWTTPSGGVSDVQVDGTSVVSQGVANVPIADSNNLGVVKVNSTYGIGLNGLKQLQISGATSAQCKAGTNGTSAIVSNVQHASVFYGLAKASGDTSQSSSANEVGAYTEDAKSSISQMLDAPETVSGSTPSITAKSGVRYICGECSTLSITAPASGCIDVVFESGSTATVLTVTSAKSGVSAIKWVGADDPTALEANKTYEVNILDGEYGVIASWT